MSLDIVVTVVQVPSYLNRISQCYNNAPTPLSDVVNNGGRAGQPVCLLSDRTVECRTCVIDLSPVHTVHGHLADAKSPVADRKTRTTIDANFTSNALLT